MLTWSSESSLSSWGNGCFSCIGKEWAKTGPRGRVQVGGVKLAGIQSAVLRAACNCDSLSRWTGLSNKPRRAITFSAVAIMRPRS